MKYFFSKEDKMDKANLADIVQKEFDLLMAAKNEALAKIAEIDRQMQDMYRRIKAAENAK